MGELFYSAREMVASKAWGDKKCFICGERFRTGNNIALLVFSNEAKKQYKSLSLNAVIHMEELNHLRSMYESEADLIEHLGNHKTPRIKMVLTDEMIHRLEIFKKSCREIGFKIEVDALSREQLYKMRMNGSSHTFSYNPFTDRLSLSSKVRKRSLGEQMMDHTLQAKLYNRMHDYLGDGKHDDFSASKIISDAIDETNKIMGN